MNNITIKNIKYNFEEKTYRINKDMSFKINLIRFEEDNSIVCLCLLKSLIININNKVVNFNPRKRVGTYGAKEFDKSLKLKDYIRDIEKLN